MHSSQVSQQPLASRPAPGRVLVLGAVVLIAGAGFLLAGPGGSPAKPQATAAAPVAAPAVPPRAPGLQVLPDVRCSGNDPDLRLPAAAEGVTDLRLGEILKRPFGDRGLEFSAKARSLDGRRVRIAGYMVKNCQPSPTQLLIAAVPVALHLREMGPCDDLPAETVLVQLRNPDPRSAAPCVAPYTPHLLVATGTLRLGRLAEREGPIPSWIQLEVEHAPAPTR